MEVLGGSEDPTRVRTKAKQWGNACECTVYNWLHSISKKMAGCEKISSLYLLKVLLDDEVPQRTEIMEEMGISKTDQLNALELEMGTQFFLIYVTWFNLVHDPQ